jgi:hypothetical protein
MKFNKWKLGLAALLLACGLSVKAQTILPPSFTGLMTNVWGAITGPGWTAGGGYGHSVSGVGRNIAGAGVAYDFVNGVGLYVGYDTLWSHSQSQQNTVKGGVTLNATITPLSFLSSSLTNITATVYVGELMATGIGNNAVGAITVTGAKIHLLNFKNFELHIDPWYENRQGQSYWDGNYVGVYLMATRLF